MATPAPPLGVVPANEATCDDLPITSTAVISDELHVDTESMFAAAGLTVVSDRPRAAS